MTTSAGLEISSGVWRGQSSARRQARLVKLTAEILLMPCAPLARRRAFERLNVQSYHAPFRAA
ncbi:MAG: hypothetical protein WBW41_07165 [Verrucomicrobiia bacterium]